MKYLFTSHRVNIVLTVLLILLGIGSFAYNQYLIDRILEQERSSVELWANAIEYTGSPLHEEISDKLLTAAEVLNSFRSVPDSIISLIEEAEADRTSQNFVASEVIIGNRFRIPTLVINSDGKVVTHRNIEESEINPDLIQRYAEMNPPFEITIGEGENAQTQYVYYGESPTVQLLRYFPFIQFSLLALLLGIAYVSYRTITKSEQSNLWVGMTKEAAHQLGTPLSSLYGWVELLKEEKKEDVFTQKVCSELEKDITRLRDVAERFNKVGSKPSLEKHRIKPIIEEVLDYMEGRLPQLGKNVELRRQFNSNVRIKINPELFQWALENLIKNAMDAIKSTNHAYVSINVHQIEDDLVIDVEDSGTGIERKFHNEVFKPGYSTKKRGWGLGLSLTKRIIENYHKGRLFVYRSEPGKGTTMRIVLNLDR